MLLNLSIPHLSNNVLYGIALSHEVRIPFRARRKKNGNKLCFRMSTDHQLWLCPVQKGVKRGGDLYLPTTCVEVKLLGKIALFFFLPVGVQ